MIGRAALIVACLGASVVPVTAQGNGHGHAYGQLKSTAPTPSSGGAAQVQPAVAGGVRNFGSWLDDASIMLMSAARDPRRNSVIVWAIAVGLAISGIAELLSIWLLGAARLFPMFSIVVHSLTRIGIALVLACLARRLLSDQKNRIPQHGGACSEYGAADAPCTSIVCQSTVI